jgi:hemin uptake protein HemP
MVRRLSARRQGLNSRKTGHVRSGRDDTRGPDQPAPPPAGKLRRLEVSEILKGEREAILEHAGQEYRLRITATGKLILTK